MGQLHLEELNGNNKFFTEKIVQLYLPFKIVRIEH